MATGEVTLGAPEGVLTSSTAAAAPAVPEGGLVAQCQAGNPDAFARLVALHERTVFNLALRLTGDPEEARDVSQDVFLQVYRKLPRFEGRSSLKTWIYRIVVNQCHNRQRWWRRRRKDRSRPLEELTAAEEARLNEAGTAVPGPHEELERREAHRRVEVALGQISFEHRAILLLREVEGLRVQQVAESLGLPEGTVKSRLSRAREALRQSLLRPGNGGRP